MSNKTSFVRNDEGLYQTKGQITSEEIIKTATEILFDQVSGRDVLNSPNETAQFLQLALANEINEHFGVLYLDNQNQVIDFEKLFNGTVDSSAVYPRVVVQKCLEKNADDAIILHNHPSTVHTHIQIRQAYHQETEERSCPHRRSHPGSLCGLWSGLDKPS